MAYRMDDIDDIPERQGPRGSKVQPVLDSLNRSPKGKMSIIDTDQVALERLYKTLIQWRARHRDAGLGIRKVHRAIYLWWEDKCEDTTPTDTPPPTPSPSSPFF